MKIQMKVDGCSQAYHEYVRLLRILHSLMLSGRGDSADADVIRDQMDGPWSLMNESEIQMVRGLSGDLYSIEEEPHAAQVATTAEEKTQIRETLQAYQSGRWDAALAGLRRTEKFFESSLVAYLRTRCWRGLGDEETAMLFLRHAIELNPEDVRYRILLFDLLQKADHLDEARQEAKRILSAPKQEDPHLVLRAAEVELAASKGMPDYEATRVYGELVEILTRALHRAESLKSRIDSVITGGWVDLGMCHEHLGDSANALTAYNKALELAPQNDAVLTARGVLLYDRDTSSSVRDFHAAISAGTTLVWPFFFLSHFNLMHEKYDSVLALTERGLKRVASTNVQASLLEWQAIAGSMTGMSDAEIRIRFRRAIALDPLNARIQHNLAEFERSIQELEIGSLDKPIQTSWDIAAADTIAKFGQKYHLLAA